MGEKTYLCGMELIRIVDPPETLFPDVEDWEDSLPWDVIEGEWKPIEEDWETTDWDSPLDTSWSTLENW
jgi:hypothetical protein